MLFKFLRTSRKPESRILDIDGVEVHVVRKRVRNFNLSVLPPTGRVRVSAPRRAPEEALRQFVVSKLDWVRRHQTEIALQAKVPRPVFVPEDLRHLKLQIAALIAKWEAPMGVKVDSYGVRRMKSRWGSCNPRSRRITISW